MVRYNNTAYQGISAEKIKAYFSENAERSTFVVKQDLEQQRAEYTRQYAINQSIPPGDEFLPSSEILNRFVFGAILELMEIHGLGKSVAVSHCEATPFSYNRIIDGKAVNSHSLTMTVKIA